MVVVFLFLQRGRASEFEQISVSNSIFFCLLIVLTFAWGASHRVPTFLLFLLAICATTFWNFLGVKKHEEIIDSPAKVAAAFAESSLSSTNIILIFTGIALGLLLRQGIAEKFSQRLSKEEKESIGKLYGLFCPIQNWLSWSHRRSPNQTKLSFGSLALEAVRFFLSFLSVILLSFLSTALGVQVLRSVFANGDDPDQVLVENREKNESARKLTQKLFGIGCLSTVGSCILISAIAVLPSSTYWLFVTEVLDTDSPSSFGWPWGLTIFGVLTCCHGHLLLRSSEVNFPVIAEPPPRFLKIGYGLLAIGLIVTLTLFFGVDETLNEPLRDKQRFGQDRSEVAFGQAQSIVKLMFIVAISLLFGQIIIRSLLPRFCRDFKPSEMSRFKKVSLWDPIREGVQRVVGFLLVFVAIVVFRDVAKVPILEMNAAFGITGDVVWAVFAALVFGLITGSMFGCVAVAGIFMGGEEGKFVAIQIAAIIAASIDHLHPISFSVSELLGTRKNEGVPPPQKIWKNYLLNAKTVFYRKQKVEVSSFLVQAGIVILSVIVALTAS